MEGLYDGKQNAGLVTFGVLNHNKQAGDKQSEFVFKIEIPNMLSLLAYRKADAFVPGINDLVYGNEKYGVESASEKMAKGKVAIQALANYKAAVKSGDTIIKADAVKIFNEHYKYIGYGYLDKPEDIIPNVALNFYSFRFMVALGVYFILLFIIVLFYSFKNNLEQKKLILKIMLWSIPLGFLASTLGWIVAEVGRQPWAIQDILPTMAATSHIAVGAVKTTFFLFLAFFTVLLIAEIKIMLKQIKIGPKE